MTGIFGDKISFKQENGPDVSLVVNGDESYARETTARVVGLLNDVERLASATSEVAQSGDARDALPE